MPSDNTDKSWAENLKKYFGGSSTASNTTLKPSLAPDNAASDQTTTVTEPAGTSLDPDVMSYDQLVRRTASLGGTHYNQEGPPDCICPYHPFLEARYPDLYPRGSLSQVSFYGPVKRATSTLTGREMSLHDTDHGCAAAVKSWSANGDPCGDMHLEEMPPNYKDLYDNNDWVKGEYSPNVIAAERLSRNSNCASCREKIELPGGFSIADKTQAPGSNWHTSTSCLTHMLNDMLKRKQEGQPISQTTGAETGTESGGGDQSSGSVGNVVHDLKPVWTPKDVKMEDEDEDEDEDEYEDEDEDEDKSL